MARAPKQVIKAGDTIGYASMVHVTDDVRPHLPDAAELAPTLATEFPLSYLAWKTLVICDTIEQAHKLDSALLLYSQQVLNKPDITAHIRPVLAVVACLCLGKFPITFAPTAYDIFLTHMQTLFLQTIDAYKPTPLEQAFELYTRPLQGVLVNDNY